MKFNEFDLDAARRELQAFLKAVPDHVVGCEDIVQILAEAYLCQEHVAMISRPGLAKSMLVGLVANAFAGGSYADLLFTAFTEPAEVYGPVDISGFAEVPSVLRYNTTGYLPDVRIYFADEAFKAGSAILNCFLTAINERKYKSATGSVSIPLESLYAASNEYPQGEELEALWDRLAYRLHLEGVSGDGDFLKMLSASYAHWAKRMLGVLPPAHASAVLVESLLASMGAIPTVSEKAVGLLRCEIVRLANPATWDTRMAQVLLDLRPSFPSVSDRRWCMLPRLVATRAVVNGHASVEAEDFECLEHVLWDRHDEKPVVSSSIQEAIARAAVDHFEENWQQISTLKRAFEGAHDTDEKQAIFASMESLRDTMNHMDPSHPRTAQAAKTVDTVALAWGQSSRLAQAAEKARDARDAALAATERALG
jgi:MoxR-like ATPase